MHKISFEDIRFIENTIENYNMEQTAGGKSLAENQERCLPERCTITITICNSDDVTEAHS